MIAGRVRGGMRMNGKRVMASLAYIPLRTPYDGRHLASRAPLVNAPTLRRKETQVTLQHSGLHTAKHLAAKGLQSWVGANLMLT